MTLSGPTSGRAGALEFVKRLPVLRDWRRRRQLARFLSPGGFTSRFGVFSTFAEARAFLPVSAGFNSREIVREYVEVRCNRVYCYDYPVMFWLSVAFAEGARSVFDIGGSVGVHYHAYRKLMSYPDSFAWLVCDVPAAVQIGREIALQREAPNLEFTDRLDPRTVRADVWISSGAIHYIEEARPNALLRACPAPPAHVILNKLPLYEGEDFVSTQNIGKGAFAPHYVYNRDRLVSDIEGEGYRLADAWEVPERSLYLPGHPEKSFDKYSGLYLRRVS